MPENLMSVTEAADLLHVSPKTIRNWINEGKIKAYRIAGTTIRLEKADVVAAFTPITIPTEV